VVRFRWGRKGSCGCCSKLLFVVAATKSKGIALQEPPGQCKVVPSPNAKLTHAASFGE
jgi:hypothetical protein